mmetsp:Transcript_25975/g.38464  ORF Transcript_25975/g.38464 Transcript_25975/m.38464 type:complete len:357 (-) Transcript_25975:245-1315(-)|eukprot:CAMPEP_0194091392 /NCGR_PEP_ID=MMETSP0149-20130528/42866_1 /TAXON_ID=122233 /ORGANISM="Chaetoceros debilis, Strain MM31A-1" /LENGTH=356 /DNA_ID=CAMNT_0038775967 /DNA_START=144 /DNA_END=1214 /DNA_ORIENTATION=+
MVQVKKKQNNALLKVIKSLAIIIVVLILTLLFHLLPAPQDEAIDRMIHNELNIDVPNVSHRLRFRADGKLGVEETASSKQMAALAQPGWKTIDVFYGDHEGNHLPTKGRGSQCHQDRLVSALLKHKQNGYFIDMAANEPVNLSNTYQLEQNNDWMGICIEPNPMYWAGLAHRKCHVAGVVVGGDTRMEEVKFRMYHDLTKRAASGGIEDLIDPKIPKGNERPTPLYTVPAQEILERYNAPIIMDYLSLDIEGAEFLVMQYFPFKDYKFRTMTVERPSQEMSDLLYDNGYIYIAGNNEDGQETAWVHSDFIDSDEIDLGAIDADEVQWIKGSTKWITLDGDDARKKRPKVNDLRIKN